MDVKSVKRYPLSKQVADKLEEMIASGEYEVGEKINTEVELMEIFSVSRNTIREAVQSLMLAGVLEVRQGDGTYVRSTSRFNASMSQKYESVTVSEIQEARNALEIAIARFAAQRRTEEDMERIERALDEREILTDSLKENSHADIAFHMEIAKACHNRILADLYESVSDYVESHIAERNRETTMNTLEIDRLHRKLCAAIRERQPEVAVAYARDILTI